MNKKSYTSPTSILVPIDCLLLLSSSDPVFKYDPPAVDIDPDGLTDEAL